MTTKPPKAHPNPKARPALRCAIYTRVSTEHGLEQEFNSLDNQREAAEAYVRSQAHEGWRLLPELYDDGGYSGGTLERLALQRLLEAVRAGPIDVIVVYKIDRLTRALSDFARLVELFDAHGASFVSVTQAFNTTTSMGRLTLNVLLSFAQFEREVTGERIRDKIAASKRKGIWMGGVVPLGYRVEARALHVVPEHAALVVEIFTGYLALGTVTALKLDLDARGITLPVRVDGAGRRTGGGAFSRGHLYKILGSPLYAGRLRHRGEIHPGQHPAIIDDETWQAVQAALSSNHHRHVQRRAASAHLLIGRIRDARDCTMTPNHAQKGQLRYRYYVGPGAAPIPADAVAKAARTSDVPATAGLAPALRIPAARIEAVVVGTLRELVPPEDQPASDAALVAEHLTSVAVHPDRLVLALTGGHESHTLAWSHQPQRVRRAIVVPPGREGEQLRPMKQVDRARILMAISKGRSWMQGLIAGRIPGTAAIAAREKLTERSVRMTLSLAHLAPSIVRAIVDARLPRGIGLHHLAELPASWAEQERILGMRSPAAHGVIRHARPTSPRSRVRAGRHRDPDMPGGARPGRGRNKLETSAIRPRPRWSSDQTWPAGSTHPRRIAGNRKRGLGDEGPERPPNPPQGPGDGVV